VSAEGRVTKEPLVEPAISLFRLRAHLRAGGSLAGPGCCCHQRLVALVLTLVAFQTCPVIYRLGIMHSIAGHQHMYV
jgi:hypothetical protein